MTRSYRLAPLRPGNPCQALAALGLLRVATRYLGLLGATLRWEPPADAVPGEAGRETAILESSDGPETIEGLAEALAGVAASRAACPEWAWSDRISGPPPDDDAIPREWSVAFGNLGAWHRSGLDLTAGGGGLLKSARRAAGASDAATVLRALAGPRWAYEDRGVYMCGLDPASEASRPGAESWGKPERRGVAAGLWLAIESLPLFAAVGRLGVEPAEITPGFAESSDGRWAFAWPTWGRARTLDEARHAVVSPPPDSVVWRAPIRRESYYGFLGWGEPGAPESIAANSA